MDSTTLSIAVGVAVIALFAGIGMLLTRSSSTAGERRLDELSGKRKSKAQREAAAALLRPPTADLGRATGWLPSVEGLATLLEQADVAMPLRQFLALTGALTVAGTGLAVVLGMPMLITPLGGAFLGGSPLLWLWWRKRRRVKKFMGQMPDALELVGRALRAGHGLASGLSVVADEMPPPIALEFSRVFEEQNLGIPLEEALRGLSERIPTMDVKFFVTAIIIQRSTGGDLAEVLDKIGHLIRERFKILGQVQALTGEGRLSGAVLLAMSPILLATIATVNPEYLDVLLETATGKKLLAVAGVLQLVGAVAIKKIVTIKV